MKDEILKRIAEFDEKPLMVKNIILSAAIRQVEEDKLHSTIMEAVYKKRGHVVGVINNIAIVETPDFVDAPFRAVILENEKWRTCTSCWQTIEQAILDGIGTHAEGCNSRFAYYAWGMIAEDRRMTPKTPF